MSWTNSPCAACKMHRRKCTQDCVFAPYFPPDNPQKFAIVHKVFGASNVGKILSDLNAVQREDAVKSLAYEAEARLRDPVYGCVGVISFLQHKLEQVELELLDALKELASHIGPQALLPILQLPGPGLGSNLSVNRYNYLPPPSPVVGIGAINEHWAAAMRLNGGGYEGALASVSANAISPSLPVGPTHHVTYPIQAQQYHDPLRYQLRAPPQSSLSHEQPTLKSHQMLSIEGK